MSTDPLLHVKTHYDFVVIGAGVAGSLVANLLADDRHTSILLVESKRFPREKVCGCCLNARGQAVLARAGLLKRVQQLGGIDIDSMNLRIGKSNFMWPMPASLSTRRSHLDLTLVEAAMEKGASFVDEVSAVVERDECDAPVRTIRLQHSTGGERRVTASIVIAADGLTQSSLKRLPEFETFVADNSRVGVQTFLTGEQWGEIAARSNQNSNGPTLTMCVDRSGYVGIAPVDGGLIDVAAAIDPAVIGSNVRPEHVVASIMERCGIAVNQALQQARWLAVPKITRRGSCTASHRIFVIGDACGYIEPFTGEGMAWALLSAEAVAPLAHSSLAAWANAYTDQWNELLEKTVIRKQWMCTQLTRMTRNPTQARIAATLCHRIPALRNWAMRTVSGG